jgi:DNA-binding transcriptional MerR regulator
MEKKFTSREVSELTGITPRQLQWWDERGIVTPHRKGHRRLYSMEDMTEISIICELRRRGFSLQRVRKVMRFLQAEFSKRLAETVSGASAYHLLIEGANLYLETSARQIVNILKNSQQPMLTICLTDTVRRVRDVIRTGKKGSGCVPAAASGMASRKLAS